MAQSEFDKGCGAAVGRRLPAVIATPRRRRHGRDADLIRTAHDTGYAAGSQAAAGLLALVEAPTALFAVSDTLAIGAIKALRHAGRRVPEGIAVMGFDNLPLSAVFEPGLTTIGQPMRELGAAVAEMVLERLSGGAPVSRTLPHQLVLRESA